MRCVTKETALNDDMNLHKPRLHKQHDPTNNFMRFHHLKDPMERLTTNAIIGCRYNRNIE